MSNQRKQITAPQEIILDEPGPLSINNPLPTPEVEIQYGELTEKQQAMVEQALDDHLASVLYEKKDRQALESITRIELQIGELYVKADFRLDMTEAWTIGRPHKKRIKGFLEKRRDKLERAYDTVGDQHIIRSAMVAGRSVYPKFKLNDGKGSLINLRLFTSEKTVLKEADQDKDLPSPVNGLNFGDIIS